MKKTFLLLSSGLAAACLLTSVHAETTTVQVSGAYAREVPPGQANSAAYMVLHNAGTEEESLVGVETPVAKKAETVQPEDKIVGDVPKVKKKVSAYVQIQSGEHLGRIIPLNQDVIQLGKTGNNRAIITRRVDNYYLSQTDGNKVTFISQFRHNDCPCLQIKRYYIRTNCKIF